MSSPSTPESWLNPSVFSSAQEPGCIEFASFPMAVFGSAARRRVLEPMREATSGSSETSLSSSPRRCLAKKASMRCDAIPANAMPSLDHLDEGHVGAGLLQGSVQEFGLVERYDRIVLAMHDQDRRIVGAGVGDGGSRTDLFFKLVKGMTEEVVFRSAGAVGLPP